MRQRVAGVRGDGADPVRRDDGCQQFGATPQRLGPCLDVAAADGIARRAVSADTVMDAIAGGAWYAVCVRRVTDVDRTAAELCELVLRGVLS